MLLVTSSKYVYRLKIRLVEGIVSFAIFDLVFCFISDKKCFYAKSVTMRKKKKKESEPAWSLLVMVIRILSIGWMIFFLVFNSLSTYIDYVCNELSLVCFCCYHLLFL